MTGLTITCSQKRSTWRQLALALVWTTVAPAVSGAQTPATTYREVLDRYCVTCHSAIIRTANLSLERVDPARVTEDVELWEKVAHKLRTREMPPPGRPRPEETVYDTFSTWLTSQLDEAAAASPHPGRTPAVHRLNRTEYANAVRDLLAVDIDARALLPADDASYGFDNIGDVLTMSQPLLERYLSAARQVSQLAVGGVQTGAVEQTYKAPPSHRQDERMSENLPFGSRGGLAIAHVFPADGEYTLRVELQRTIMSGFIKGLGRYPGARSHEIDIRLDGQLLKRLTIQAAAIPEELARAQLPPRQTLTNELIVRVPVSAGPHLVAATFPEAEGAPEGFFLPLPTRSYSHAEEAGEYPAVDSLIIGGPYEAAGPGESPSRDAIFVCLPSSVLTHEACASQILSRLARRAFRGPVSAADVAPLVDAYRRQRSAGATFETGVQAGVEAILVHPRFLFRVELDPAGLSSGEVYTVSDLELASRLSFFLWSSVPDDELLDLAGQGRLSTPAVLDTQVRRMLADPKSEALRRNFFGQWLYLRNLAQLQPDAELYPAFDDELRDAFRRETELVIDRHFNEDRSVVDLLHTRDTYVNERLAAFYGVPHVYGSHFRPVTLPDNRRAGILGHGSVLTVTSYANRTSPVLRGKFVLEQILGTPPPPPPPDVPPLEEDELDGSSPRSTRARLEQHRNNPVCATCHAKIDPLGFALENFDPIGRWRDTDNGAAIDASGTLADGTTFVGPEGFRGVLLDRREQFVTNLTHKLLTYALGRGLDAYDQPSVRGIVRAAAADDYRWSALVNGIVRSTPFRMRQVP